ncbi:MAG TPA: thiamine phosphate synthase [Thermoanaerobaculia bacterium]|nr:thiamine phosphate synthase [Thermoanaerobaculia bacterium]
MNAAAPRLLAISDRAGLAEPFATWLARLGPAGADLQLREKHLDDRALHRLARTARTLLPPGSRLLINGRADLAIATGAEGVHLPASGLPAAPLRALTERRDRRLLIGRSTHAPDEVAAARDEGVDYVTFGPVYPTPSKARYGAPPGLEGLCRASALGVPVLALGGVTADRVAEVAAAGAAGVAAIRACRDPGELDRLAAAVRAAFGAAGAVAAMRGAWGRG